MILQSNEDGCGPAALANALAALGWQEVPQETIAELAGQTVDGCGSRDLARAARSLGASVEVVQERRCRQAYQQVYWWLLHGRSCVLCVDDGEHWVTAIGVLGDELVVCDPAAALRPKISTMSEADLVSTWRWRKKNRNPNRAYYALVVGPKEE